MQEISLKFESLRGELIFRVADTHAALLRGTKTGECFPHFPTILTRNVTQPRLCSVSTCHYRRPPHVSGVQVSEVPGTLASSQLSSGDY